MATSTVRVTYCPPQPARGLLAEEVAFGKRYDRRPVSIEWGADGEATGTGLSFDDFSGARVVTRKLASGRKQPAPLFVHNPALLREVLARFFERRAGIRWPRKGSVTSRIAYANRKLRLTIPQRSEALSRMCREHLILKQTGADPKRRATLECLIEGLDSQLIAFERGPAYVAAVAYMYWNLGHESVSIALALDLKPPAVRKILYRLRRIAGQMDEPKSARARR